MFCTFVGKSKRIKTEQELKRDSARKSLIENQQVYSGENNWSYNLIRQGGIIHRVRNGANLAELMQCTGLSVAALEKYLLFGAGFHSH